MEAIQLMPVMRSARDVESWSDCGPACVVLDQSAMEAMEVPETTAKAEEEEAEALQMEAARQATFSHTF